MDLIELLGASENGLPELSFLKGFLYQSGHGVPKDLALAYSHYVRAAEAGSVLAQYLVASMLLSGAGAQKNISKAAKWLKEAASRGHAPSAYTLYEIGRQHLLDDALASESMVWLRKAASLGLPLAMYKLGEQMQAEKNSKEAMIWYTRAADCGSAVACDVLANIYSNGWHDVAADPARAKNFLASAAQLRQHKDEQYLQLLRQAAEHGSNYAQLLLAEAYRRGFFGLEVDLGQAAFWEKQASQKVS